MLHVTNGDSAAERMRAAGVEGPILPWRDVLHDGPVPAGLPLKALSRLRADFIAGRDRGAVDEARRSFAERDRTLAASSSEDEVVLWFEHDLYDQLQLIQLLDWFADHPHPRLTLINPAEYLGLAGPDRLRELFAARAPVTDAQLALGRAAWEAFRAPDPRQVERVIQGDTTDLPHLGSALRRLLEEYPSGRGGISRSERQALESVGAGPRPLREAYPAAHQARESAIWMGDWSFASMVNALAAGARPLLAFEDGMPVDAGDPEATLRRVMSITPAGRDVLSGEADAVALSGIDRWIGGVHLAGREATWRWDADEQRIVRA